MGQRAGLIAAVAPHVGPTLQKALPHMGDASLFHLATALVATTTPGVAGDLILRVPRKVSDRMEVSWRSAPPTD